MPAASLVSHSDPRQRVVPRITTFLPCLFLLLVHAWNCRACWMKSHLLLTCGSLRWDLTVCYFSFPHYFILPLVSSPLLYSLNWCVFLKVKRWQWSPCLWVSTLGTAWLPGQEFLGNFCCPFSGCLAWANLNRATSGMQIMFPVHPHRVS